MDENLSQQILDALFPSLEAMDTKTTALLQLLKDKGIATQEEIATCLEQAANASNVRWRAARVRLDYLLSSAAKPPDQAAEKKSPQPAENREPVSETSGEDKDKKQPKTETTAADKTAAPDESTVAETGAEKEKTSPEPTAEKEKEKEKADTGDPTTAAA